jgi:tripartite-type tricarboxylate transporter receptor subunit TctC
MPANDLHELIVWLKANPNKASSGISTAGYRLLNLAFQKETGTRYTLVPYRGTLPMVQDLLAGNIDLWFGSADQLPLVRAGSIKAYAVTGEMRLAAAPDIPTFDEMGLPAGGGAVPACRYFVSNLPARAADAGGTCRPAKIRKMEKWWTIIKAAGIKPE